MPGRCIWLQSLRLIETLRGGAPHLPGVESVARSLQECGRWPARLVAQRFAQREEYKQVALGNAVACFRNVLARAYKMVKKQAGRTYGCCGTLAQYPGAQEVQLSICQPKKQC